jgi:lactate permease
VTWTQVYDPAGRWWLSTLIAALPIIVLLGLLAGLKVRAHLCAIAGAATAVIVAIAAFKMPALLAVSSFFYGSAFALLKIVWIVIAAVFLYDISVATGQFEIMKQSVAAITPDRRLQLLLVAFCFGAFIEGCAGFGAPVAIAGAFMIGLGFRPFPAAVLNLIANTSPVMGRDRNARSHAGGCDVTKRKRFECDDRPHPSDHSADCSGVASPDDG